MTPKFRSLARSGLVALSVIGGLSISASAGPAGMANDRTLAATANPGLLRGDGWSGLQNLIDVRQVYRGGRSYHRGWRGNNGWRGHRPYRNYNGNYYRRNYGGYYGNYYRNRPSVYFNFAIPFYGLGVPNYYYGQNYDYGPSYYRPAYRYNNFSSAHERWCYNRYRSYRAYDNTFQPYYGGRRQCWSPYR